MRLNIRELCVIMWIGMPSSLGVDVVEVALRFGTQGLQWWGSCGLACLRLL